MPSLIPVDGDPFADDTPSAPSSAPAIAFSSGPGGGGPAAPAARDPVLIPIDHDPFVDDPAGASEARPLTIHGSRRAPPLSDASAPIAGSAAVVPAGLSPSPVQATRPSDAAPQSSPSPGPGAGLTDVEAATPPTPHPGGVLSNSYDDGYVSGALKGAGTGAIKGAGQAVGAVGGLGGLADYLIARAHAAVTGRPLDAVQADLAERRRRAEADMSATPLGRLAVASDPTKVLPAPDDVSGPILRRTGEYVPTSESGKIAQAAVEGAVGAFGPGGGMVSPGTAGRAALGALARQAPAVAAAGGVGQGVTDFTGDPLLGLGAGLVGVPLAEAGLSKAASAAAPVVGGSALNGAPVIGPMIRRARENRVAGMVLGSADDPAAVRAAVAQPAPEPAVPGSPQTFAGQIGTDQGLLEAEKALRNTKAEKLTDGSAPTYFNAVDRAQSAAQTAALQGLQPTGDVFRPGQVLAQRMDAVDAAAQDAIDRLQAAHADAVVGRAQAGLDFRADQRADLADRIVARGQASGDAKAAAAAARQAQHDQLVQGFADAEARQRQAAQDTASPLAGGEVPADALGGALRSSVEAVRAGQKDIHRQLYQAVDPRGDLALVATPISDGAARIAGEVRDDGSAMSPAEAPLFARAAALPDVAPYRVVHALDRDVGAAMSAERRAGGESPAWARLSRLKGSMKDAMTGAADAQAAWERSQVDAGAMAHEDTIEGRLRADTDEWDAAAQQTEARRATGTGDPASSNPGAFGVSRPLGTEVSSGRGSRNAPRDPGLSPTRGAGAVPQGIADGQPTASPFDVPVSPEIARSLGTGPGRGATQEALNGESGASFSMRAGAGDPRFDAPPYDPDGLRAPPRPDVPRPQDLRAFVRSRGGVVDTGGDLAAMGMRELIAKRGGGLDPDRMREVAAEAGYLGADTDRAMRETHPNDLLDALSGDRPVHAVRDEDAAVQWAAYDEARERYADARQTFSRSSFGARRDPAPLSVYSRDDVEGPGGPQVPEPPRSGLVPNFDREAEGRLRAANAAYRQYAQTYRQRPVASGLRTTGYAGQYRGSDAAFIKAAVKTGPEGYANARAFLQAARNDPDAVAAMHDAVLNPLRRLVTGNGTVIPAGLERWKSPQGYGSALRAFDEVTPGFSSHFDTAADATQALLDLGIEHKAALEAHQAEAARQAVLDNVRRREALGQANAADRTTVDRLLADRRSADRAADARSRADADAGMAAARGMLAEAKASPAARFAGKVGGAVAPEEVENGVGGLLRTGTDGAARMRSLVASVADDPDALAGLRKAAVDWIVRHHMGADGLLKGGALTGFLRENRPVLDELFPHDQRTMFGALARDAEVNTRWRTSTAIKGGSDTVKNLLAALDREGGAHGGHVTLGMAAVEAIAQGLEHAGIKGAAIGGAGAALAYLGNTLRQAGIRRTADLYREVMANPELARAFISKMPATPDGAPLQVLARVLRRGLILGPMVVGEAREREVERRQRR